MKNRIPGKKSKAVKTAPASEHNSVPYPKYPRSDFEKMERGLVFVFDDEWTDMPNGVVINADNSLNLVYAESITGDDHRIRKKQPATLSQVMEWYLKGNMRCDSSSGNMDALIAMSLPFLSKKNVASVQKKLWASALKQLKNPN